MLIPGHRTPPTTATAHSFLISEASTLALVKPRLAADSGPVRFYPIRTPLSSLLRSLPRSGPARAARAHVRTYAAVRAAQESARKLGIGRRSRPAGGCHVRAVALRSSFPMRRSVGFGFLVPFWCDIPAKRTAPGGCRYEWAAGWASTAAYIYAARLPRPPRARPLPAGRRNLPGTLPDPAGRGARLSAPQGRHHVSPVTYACSALDSRPLVCPIREEINCWERDANERNRLTKRWLRYSLLIVTGEHYPTVHGACVIHRCADVN